MGSRSRSKAIEVAAWFVATPEVTFRPHPDAHFPGDAAVTTGRTISTPLPRCELARLAEEQFGDWIKAVVDVSRGIMAVGGDLHADDEAALLAEGSSLRDLWGINLFPEEEGRDWIELDSMINIRPRDDNRSRGVDDPRPPRTPAGTATAARRSCGRAKSSAACFSTPTCRAARQRDCAGTSSASATRRGCCTTGGCPGRGDLHRGL